ncbi:MAG: hypothetical protein WAS33_26155 [Candidatus Promineifilaceae bacterium]
MRSFPLRRDLGLQLLALWLLFVLLVVVAVLVFESVASRRLEADIKAADLALARAVAQETDAAMGNALSAVQKLATFPAVQSANISEMDTLFGILFTARSDVNLIYRLSEQGIMLYHYPLRRALPLGPIFPSVIISRRRSPARFRLSLRGAFRRRQTSQWQRPLCQFGAAMANFWVWWAPI